MQVEKANNKNYDRTMRISITDTKLISAIETALKHKNGTWLHEGQTCKIVDMVRIERTNYIELRLARAKVKL